MEVKFENCCTLTKDALLAMNKKSTNPVFTATVIVLCLALVVNGVRAAIDGYPQGLVTPLLGAAALAAFAYFLPRVQGAIEYRKNLIAFGREAKCITKFYDDKFVVENLSNGKISPISYSRIRKVADDERYVFLLLDTRIISPVDKNDFIVGTAEDFLSFIDGKAVNTKRGGGKPDNALP